MAVQTQVSVRDNMSASFAGITNAINTCLGAFVDLQAASSQGLSPAQFENVQSAMVGMNAAARQFGDALNDANNDQHHLNNSIHQGASGMDGLVRKVMGLVGAYASFRTLTGALNLSDQMTSTAARLDMMNDGLQTTAQLQNAIMQSAQNARGSYLNMAAAVAKLGNNAGDAFDSTAEIVKFSELVQKQFSIAGASATESSNAMLQLTQALGSGVLRGDELNSIFEQAPNLIKTIADYMDVNIGDIRQMASEGKITADIVKNAMFDSADEIDETFKNMPMTWAQIGTSIQNTAIAKFQPILQKLNDIANSDRFQGLMNGLIDGLAMIAAIATPLIDGLVSGASFVYDNWSTIEPLFWGLVAVLGAYAAICAITAGIQGGLAIITAIHTAFTTAWSFATFAATVAQDGLNAALLACPITWIIILVIALVAAIIAVCQWIANATGVANSWFGVMSGGVFVVGAAFKNLGSLIADIALGIWNALGAVCTNIGVAFSNTISGVQSWFYNLLSTVLTVVAGICEALNNLPFVEFDYSGITSAASDYAAKSAEADGNKQEYASVVDAFGEGMATYDYFEDGWATDAFNAGASWGDGISENVSNAIDGFMNPGDSIFSGADDYTSMMGGISDNTGAIADSTGKMADKDDEDKLEWLKDIAEREVIDRTVFRDIKVDLGGVSNVVNNMADLDGVADYLGNVIAEQMSTSGEGVYA